MENLLNLFSSLLKNKTNNENSDSSNISTILPLLTSMFENNKKGTTEVAPKNLSEKLNALIHMPE